MQYKKRRKDYKVEDFWKVVKEDVLPGTKAKIETYRALVLNPFSHYDTEKHEFKTELRGAIDAVKGLKSELTALLTPSA